MKTYFMGLLIGMFLGGVVLTGAIVLTSENVTDLNMNPYLTYLENPTTIQSSRTFEQLMTSPLKNGNGELIIKDVFTYKDYEITKGYIETAKNIYVPFLLSLPKNPVDSNAIIVAHQHNGDYTIGKNSEMFWDLVERNHIVMSIDSFFFGERQIISANEIRTAERLLSQKLYYRGLSPMNFILQEDIATVNYLMSLDDVDSVSCIGHSFGGERCLLLSAIDDRINIAIVSGAYTDTDTFTSLDNSIAQGNTVLIPNLFNVITMEEIVERIAPRKLIIANGIDDPVRPASKVHLDEQKGLTVIAYEGEHHLTDEIKEELYEIL